MYYGREKKYYLPEGRIAEVVPSEYLSSREGLLHAAACGIIIEAVAVKCDINLTLHFDFGFIEGIIEKSESAYCRPGEYIKDIAIITRVGKPVCFKVLSIESNENGEFVRLSRRAAQLDCVANYLSDIVCGDIIPARVTHLESFGAFCDIGCGLSSLMTVDSISVSRISHPADRLSCGDDIYSVVKSIDPDNGRFFISQRELYGTWEQNAVKFSPGSTVSGIVRSIENYGVFIELAPNLAGLAEIRSDTKSAVKSYDALSVGQCVSVYIKSIIPEKMKIKLVIIDTLDDKFKPPLHNVGYFLDCDKTKHINRWLYSPTDCDKVVESVFETI